MKNRFLSIIIPLFNEESRVEKAVGELEKYLSVQDFSTQVIFVDDGSTDKTVRKIKELKPKFDFEITSYRPNRGKGYAIKKGVASARSDYLFFCDVDMSTPLQEFNKFLPFIRKKIPVIIGTRKAAGAKIIKRQPYLRQKMGEVFTMLSNILLGSSISDYTCGFKCFSGEASEKIFSLAKINRWSYDSEILFLANKLGFKITEVPVVWKNDSRTKVNLFRDIIESFTDLLRIRLNDRAGHYD